MVKFSQSDVKKGRFLPKIPFPTLQPPASDFCFCFQLSEFQLLPTRPISGHLSKKKWTVTEKRNVDDEDYLTDQRGMRHRPESFP
jgi:hypothetical protein